MHRQARRVRSTSILAMLAALLVAGCASGAPSAVVGSAAVPTSSPGGAGPATPSAEPSTGAPATIPDPCTLLPKAAIDSILGGTADVGTQSELQYRTGLACDFDANNGASLEVIAENDFATVSEFTDQLGLMTDPVPGLGEAAQYLYTDFGTPPGAILWVYAKGLAIGMQVYKSGLTEAGGLDLLKALAANLPPRS